MRRVLYPPLSDPPCPLTLPASHLPSPLPYPQTAINYLAIPAILAMLAYAAVSFPEQTANSVYAVLEFVKEHPTASSIGIIVGAGALLGPDLLAGTAVAGKGAHQGGSGSGAIGVTASQSLLSVGCSQPQADRRRTATLSDSTARVAAFKAPGGLVRCAGCLPV